LRAGIDGANKKLKTIFPDVHRRLQSSQKEVFLLRIDELKSLFPVLYIYAFNLGDSPRFGLDFFEFFTEQKIQAVGPILTFCDDQKERGILVGMQNPESPSDKAIAFFRILKDAGFSPTPTKWYQVNGDFDLFICPE